MKKFSMYMTNEEVERLDEARVQLVSVLGIDISRNAFIRSLLTSFMKESEVRGLSRFFKEPSKADLPNIIAETAV